MRNAIHQAACLALGLLGGLGAAQAATNPEQFTVRNTQDIIAVCSTAPDDPLYTAAIHFCHGYLVGAFQYQQALYDGPGLKPVVCPPEPKPTRNQAVARFIEWAKAHPEHGNERAVESLGRFLSETWPCKG